MNYSMPGFPVFHYLLDLAQTHVHWVSDTNPTILSSVTPFSSCPQSFPASGSFPVNQLFASGGQSIGASASESALPMNIQGWFPLGLTGLISLLSKGLSRVFSSTTVWKYQFWEAQPFLWEAQPFLWPNSHIHTWLLEKPVVLCKKVKMLVAQSCPTLCIPMDCSLPGSSIQGILPARILEWVAIPFSRGSSWPRNWTGVSCIAGDSLPAELRGIQYIYLISTDKYHDKKLKERKKKTKETMSFSSLLFFCSLLPPFFLSPPPLFAQGPWPWDQTPRVQCHLQATDQAEGHQTGRISSEAGGPH